MRLSVLILLNNTHQIAHLSLLYLACRAGTTELFYGAWSTKKAGLFYHELQYRWVSLTLWELTQLGYFIGHADTTGLFCCDAGRLAIAQLGYFIAAHNWVICDAGFESRTVAIAQLGYFIAAHNWVISHNWVICDAEFESRTVAIAQLGYFIAAHNWVIS